MMIILFCAFIGLCLFGMKLKPADGAKYMTDYMSVEKTMAIKGIFILIVFFSHFNSYVTFTATADVLYHKAFSLIGQCMVTMFLFYSGYGVMESIKKKNMAYIRKIPVTRILGTYFRFAVAILFFLVIDIIFSREFTIPQLLLSFTGWDSMGNSNWYIFAVVIAYLVTFIAFSVGNLITEKASSQVRNYISAAIVTVLCCVYIYILAHFNLKEKHWYDTIICYAAGIWYSLVRDKIEKIINYNLPVYALFFLVTGAGTAYFALNRGNSFIHTELSMLFFMTFIVIFTMRISLNNKILVWCGKNLFGLYILQRIPMIVFKELGLADFNIYLFFFASLVVTVPFAWLFEKYTGRIWNMISSPKKKTDSKTA